MVLTCATLAIFLIFLIFLVEDSVVFEAIIDTRYLRLIHFEHATLDADNPLLFLVIFEGSASVAFVANRLVLRTLDPDGHHLPCLIARCLWRRLRLRDYNFRPYFTVLTFLELVRCL